MTWHGQSIGESGQGQPSRGRVRGGYLTERRSGPFHECGPSELDETERSRLGRSSTRRIERPHRRDRTAKSSAVDRGRRCLAESGLGSRCGGWPLRQFYLLDGGPQSGRPTIPPIAVRQAELIRTWRPWERSTGPTSGSGKTLVSRNPWKGGIRALLRKLSCELRKQHEALDGQK